jgi:hypothetical protein
MFRITITEDGKKKGPFDTPGPIKISFTRETPDYSEYTSGDPAEFVVRCPGHEIWTYDDAEVTIEELKRGHS